MKVAKLAIGVVLMGGLTVGTGWAQSPRQQALVEPGAYGYAQAEDTAASPSDAPGVASAVSRCNSCTGAAYGSCPTCPGVDEPFRVFGRHSSGIEVGGWISVGGYANEYGVDKNGPLGFNTVGDGVNLHQLWGYVAKETDTGGFGVDWGARVDYVFGIDGPDTQAFRGTQWDVDWDTGRDYGSAIPQAYAEIAIDYLKVKAGYFYTPIGYEHIQAPENFFYSHSYTQYYIEPFTHTGRWPPMKDSRTGPSTAVGRRAGTPLGDDRQLQHVSRRAHLQPRRRPRRDYMTSVGRLNSLTARRGDVYMHSIVMELGLTERLDWIIQSDLHYRDGEQHELTAGGVSQYLI